MAEIEKELLPENLNLGFPPSDLVFRGDVERAIQKACVMGHIPFRSWTPEGRRTLEAMQAVRNVPAADAVKVVHSRWEIRIIEGKEKACCSHCDQPNKLYTPPYCPHCGAKMDGGLSMTKREKLMYLIINAKRTDPETGSFSEWLADFLLGYGVVVPMDDDPSAERLSELIEADKAGRCVVLPFKVGDEAWVIRTLQDGKETKEVHNAGKIKQISMNDYGTFLVVDCCHTLDVADVGKTVFGNREEAEAALKKMKEV